jgi:hypothetical protein
MRSYGRRDRGCRPGVGSPHAATFGLENNITFHGIGEIEPLADLVRLRTVEDLAAFLSSWAGGQIQELYDQIPGAEPVQLVKKGRQKAVDRIWNLMQKLKGE